MHTHAHHHRSATYQGSAVSYAVRLFVFPLRDSSDSSFSVIIIAMQYMFMYYVLHTYARLFFILIVFLTVATRVISGPLVARSKMYGAPGTESCARLRGRIIRIPMEMLARFPRCYSVCDSTAPDARPVQ
jgi:hypothetical protein